MKPYIFNVINAIILITAGSFGYFGSANPSVTALIPVFTGLILLLMVKGLKNENKTIAHIVVILTFLTVIALFKPLTGAFDRSDSAAIFRVLLMMLAGLLALAVYIKSFIEARRGR